MAIFIATTLSVYPIFVQSMDMQDRRSREVGRLQTPLNNLREFLNFSKKNGVKSNLYADKDDRMCSSSIRHLHTFHHLTSATCAAGALPRDIKGVVSTPRGPRKAWGYIKVVFSYCVAYNLCYYTQKPCT